jgi:1-acyl-sn-glycerol-3-phosphate acyltransferase
MWSNGFSAWSRRWGAGVASSRARPGAFLYRATRALTIFVEWLLTRPRITGAERVPETGGLLVVANHASNADPVILMAVMNRSLAFMTKEELFRPFFGRLFLQTWGGAFPVRRGEMDIGAIREALNLIQSGHAVVLFPEGTRTRGGLGPGHPGIGYLARRARCPVLPIAIVGSEKMQNIWSLRYRPRFEVHIGEPFVVADETRDPAEVRDEIMERLATMLPVERRGIYGDRTQVLGVG